MQYIQTEQCTREYWKKKAQIGLRAQTYGDDWMTESYGLF